MPYQPIDELDHKLQRAKESLFTGVLAIGTSAQVEWYLYFLVGQIVWANGHTHSKRRWHRQFLKYSPHLRQRTLKEIVHQAQNYKTVAQLVMNQEFSREQFTAIVRGCISEVLFDIIYRATSEAQTPLAYKVIARNGANFPCIGLSRGPIWQQVQQDWQAWQQANLVSCGPNLAPKIIQPAILQERTSSDTFAILQKLANGTQTLRDISVRTGQPLIPLTQSLLPHVRRDLIKLMAVDDLVVNAPVPPRPAVAAAHVRSHPQPLSHGPTVAYIDDNPADSQSMANIFQGSGYRYVNIADPLKALPQLIELKPQLIFLDLVMPVVNGYELCAQIRRVSRLQGIPVIIMTNNNGIPDRVRAKVVGATGFLGKPIKAKQVLKTVLRHLQPSVSPPVKPPHFARLAPSMIS